MLKKKAFVTPKKTVAKKVVVKVASIKKKKEVMTRTELNKFLAENKFEITDCDEDGWRIEHSNRWENEVRMGWELNTLPNCCGIIEIGGFDFDKDMKVSKEILVEVTKFALLEQINENKRGISKRLLMLSLIDNEACNIIEQAVKEMPSYFSEIRSFVNIGTSNTVTVYISI